MTTIDTLNARAAANIRGEIAKRKITHQELADLLKWPRSSITELVNENTQITLSKLEQIADVLKVEPSKLLND